MLIIKQQNIDCEISKFEDASGDGFDDHDVDENGYDAHDYDEELSLDYGQNGTNQDVSESRKSVKVSTKYAYLILFLFPFQYSWRQQIDYFPSLSRIVTSFYFLNAVGPAG